jgi:hypothetical protein
MPRAYRECFVLVWRYDWLDEGMLEIERVLPSGDDDQFFFFSNGMSWRLKGGNELRFGSPGLMSSRSVSLLCQLAGL